MLILWQDVGCLESLGNSARFGSLRGELSIMENADYSTREMLGELVD